MKIPGGGAAEQGKGKALLEISDYSGIWQADKPQRWFDSQERRALGDLGLSVNKFLYSFRVDFPTHRVSRERERRDRAQSAWTVLHRLCWGGDCHCARNASSVPCITQRAEILADEPSLLLVTIQTKTRRGGEECSCTSQCGEGGEAKNIFL